MLKLKRFSEGVWFDYPLGGRFKIRAVTPKNYLDLREKAKTGKSTITNLRGEQEIIDTYDEARFYWLIFIHMLEAWEGIEIEGATTEEEIKETIFNDALLRDWIGDKSREIFSQKNDEFEEELKNSDSSQDGSSRSSGKNAKTAKRSI